MDNQGWIGPCRVVPFDGGGDAGVVGPPDATCTSGGWSPDGEWLYLTSNHGGRFHIWRQRFPDGTPEQLTSGPTEEDGIAMAADGKSAITSVGIEDSSVWVHDVKGEHQISPENYSGAPQFSPDSRRLYYLRFPGETWTLNFGSPIWPAVPAGQCFRDT
jgi:sugar lactone lactonase YvrE